MSHVTQQEYSMGWQRGVGSLNLYASPAKEPYFCRALLPNRPRNLGNLFVVDTPQHICVACADLLGQIFALSFGAKEAK